MIVDSTGRWNIGQQPAACGGARGDEKNRRGARSDRNTFGTSDANGAPDGAPSAVPAPVRRGLKLLIADCPRSLEISTPSAKPRSFILISLPSLPPSSRCSSGLRRVNRRGYIPPLRPGCFPL